MGFLTPNAAWISSRPFLQGSHKRGFPEEGLPASNGRLVFFFYGLEPKMDFGVPFGLPVERLIPKARLEGTPQHLCLALPCGIETVSPKKSRVPTSVYAAPFKSPHPQAEGCDGAHVSPLGSPPVPPVPPCPGPVTGLGLFGLLMTYFFVYLEPP